MSGLEERCNQLRDPGVVTLIMSIVILVGMLISYLPQHIRIISRGTSEGISPFFVLLGVTSATSGFANILTLPQSRQDVACCQDLDTLHCLAGLLGMAQLGVQWICFAFILVLFLVFFRYNGAAVPEEELGDDQPRWQTAVTVAIVCLLHGLAVIIITAIFAVVFPGQLSAWANFLGIMAAVLAAVQYFPQIWTTYHLKHVGSLSIPMMLIQTPGGILFALSLFFRLGWSGWSSWGIFVLTAIMQGILLGLAIYYQLQSARDAAAQPKRSTRPAENGGGSYGATGGPQQQQQQQQQQQHPHLHSNGFDDDVPGPYSNHPEHYAETPEQLQTILDRQDTNARMERQPLLKPGGIGGADREYASRRSGERE